MPRFVLIHSPVVGPATWAPVAARLADAGCGVTAPSLLAAVNGDPPFWPRVAAAVAEAVGGAPCGPAAVGGATAVGSAQAVGGAAADEPLVLVAHSNAGVFVPVIRAALARRVRCSVFADASLPARAGATPTAGDDFLPFLRGLAGPDGRLPRWTDWWPEEDLSLLFPGPAAREAVTRELPRLPLAYYTERVPAPPGWDDHPCAYLHFSAAYDGEAQEAAERGWPVRRLPGEHLHQLVDPAGVATALLDLARQAGP